jgi:hypothetical protein
MSGANKMLWLKSGPKIKNWGKTLKFIDSASTVQVIVNVLISKLNKKESTQGSAAAASAKTAAEKGEGSGAA